MGGVDSGIGIVFTRRIRGGLLTLRSSLDILETLNQRISSLNLVYKDCDITAWRVGNGKFTFSTNTKEVNKSYCLTDTVVPQCQQLPDIKDNVRNLWMSSKFNLSSHLNENATTAQNMPKQHADVVVCGQIHLFRARHQNPTYKFCFPESKRGNVACLKISFYWKMGSKISPYIITVFASLLQAMFAL